MNDNNIIWKSGLVLASILISLFVAEIILRSVFPYRVNYFVWQPNLHFTFHPDSTILNGIHGAKNFDINSEGFRGKEFSDGGIKYLCIGGSTTESLDVDNNECWTHQLEEILNSKFKYRKFQIGSIGKSGCTTRDHYMQVKYFVPQLGKIDGVILMCGFNDMSKRLSRDSLFENDFRFTPPIEDSLLRSNFLQGKIEKIWWKRTALYRLFFQKYFPRVQTGSVSWEIEDDKGEIIRTWRNHRASYSAIIDTLPDLTPALHEFERNLNLIYGETKKQGVKLILINQASLFKDSMSNYEKNLLWTGGIGNFQKESNHPYYSAKALKTALKYYNERLEKFCAGKSVKFIDLDSQLPKDTSVFYDDCHFTEKGERKVAEVISSELLK